MNYLDMLEKALLVQIKNEEELVARYSAKDKPWIWEEERHFHEGKLEAYKGTLEMVKDEIANELLLWEKDLHSEYMDNWPPISREELL